MNFKNKLIDPNQLKNINIQELLKYGVNVYSQNDASEFEDSIGSSYIRKENSTAYLSNNSLILKYTHAEMAGVTPDQYSMDLSEGIDDLKDIGVEAYIMITADKIEYLEVSRSQKEELSDDEKDLLTKMESLIQQAEEKNSEMKKIEKQHVRNFFRNLFKSKKQPSLISDGSDMTSQKIKAMIDSIHSVPKKPLSDYIVNESDLIPPQSHTIEDNTQNKIDDSLEDISL